MSSQEPVKRRIVVGITGASGVVYGASLLEALAGVSGIETHLIISETGLYLLSQEIGDYAPERMRSLAGRLYDIHELSAPLASGSFRAEGMIIAPCSAKTLSAVANGYDSNLISRAADVTLKERRRLVLLFRETPLTLAHIDNMRKVTEMGGIVLPPAPAFYHKPGSIDDIINHTIGKTLDLFDIDHDLYERWSGPS